ncbi:hypothetical protein M011DRAFT_412990 [Sporormia fimetaria CBS 119925]|uniref:Wings apart-like protein C-terminal domain-containing protein n=1 Tax=Sporormia fimetaria CBS 119925 TaxID=1340428 RepID=A0A6A6UVS1_9PLEO|nr:hypothetical protein M011DRAFT_412990 [Sporormia fimetaria CBS 119925]
MSSAFTAAHRRKRILTYGKASRTATTRSWHDDATSPERPRKHVGALRQSPDAPSRVSAARSRSQDRLNDVPKPPAHTDVFDIPSEPDTDHAPKSTKVVKKLGTKKPETRDVFDVPSSDEDPLPQRRGKTPLPLRKSAVKKPAPGALSRPNRMKLPPTTQSTSPQQTGQDTGGDGLGDLPHVRQVEKGPNAGSKTQMHHPKPAPPTPAAVKKLKCVSIPSPEGIKKKRPSPDRDIFDVPSSDEDRPAAPKRARPLKTLGSSKRTEPESTAAPPRLSPDVDHRKQEMPHKRALLVQNGLARHHPRARANGELQTEGQEPTGTGMPAQTSLPTATRSLDSIEVNKPKRTRLRTIPVLQRSKIGKAPSSPAKLSAMVAFNSQQNHLDNKPVPNLISQDDDDTMYEITGTAQPSTPIRKNTKPTTSGTVTPRQTAMLGSLLGDADTGSNGMPSIRRLQLTARKAPTLSRSSSDVPQSAFTRKTRLVDLLKHDGSASEGDDESSDDRDIKTPTEARSRSRDVQEEQVGDTDTAMAEDLDVDSGAANNNSQASQSSLLPESKVTYARSRSYRQEASLEDDLLLSMDVDDTPALRRFGSNRNRLAQSESEDEGQDSQVRGIHELRRQGENQKFQMEAQTAIDEIADRAKLGKSVRRSALLDFCTRMTHKKFLDFLIESSLVHQFLAGIAYTGEIIFDFTACMAVAIVLSSNPDAALMEEIHASGILDTVVKLLDLDTDISRIARERKTNLSKAGRETVEAFRALVQASSIWSPEVPDTVTPEIVALKTLELLVLQLRKSGNTEALVNSGMVHKLLDVSHRASEHVKNGKETSQNLVILHIAFSTLEAAAISAETEATWSGNVLQRLRDEITVFLGSPEGSPVKLAIRLCILLTNNRPKACEVFADPSFVKPLVKFINDAFSESVSRSTRDEAGTREDLILTLGAMINIAEYSDRARTSVIADGDEPLNTLVATFVDGSRRAAEADSVEETQASVPIGYLTVLLGNLSLNDEVRRKIQAQLPDGNIKLLVEKVKEFVSFHERVDRMTKQFEGAEGREVSENYTKRLMQVVRRLEREQS